MSPLVLGEILGVFVNTLTANDKYPVQDCDNLPLPTQMQLSEKRKTFSEFFLHFWNLDQILKILKRSMILIVNVFPKLQTVKILVRRVFVNTVTAEGKYPVQDWENLPLPMQMLLSDIWKTFSQFFVPFLESTEYL